MTIVQRLIKLFQADPPPIPPHIVEEVEMSRKALDASIKRAEKTTARVMRRSEKDSRRAGRFIEAVKEVADQLQRPRGQA